MKRTKLFFIVVVFLLSCSYTRVETIRNDPEEFTNKKVKIRAVLKRSYPLSDELNLLVFEDNVTILALSGKDLRKKEGKKIAFTGNVIVFKIPLILKFSFLIDKKAGVYFGSLKKNNKKEFDKLIEKISNSLKDLNIRSKEESQ